MFFIALTINSPFNCALHIYNLSMTSAHEMRNRSGRSEQYIKGKLCKVKGQGLLYSVGLFAVLLAIDTRASWRNRSHQTFVFTQTTQSEHSGLKPREGVFSARDGGERKHLGAIRFHNADEPLFEGAVFPAVGWLFPASSPPRMFPTTSDLAIYSKVDGETVEEVVPMTDAYSGGTVGH